MTRSLNSNSGCDLKPNSDASADIANGAITIDQVDGGKTVIRWISPPKNFRELYKDQATRDTGARSFLTDLKQAISSDDPDAVAKLCSYPFHAHFAGHEVWMHDRAQTLREYQQVFTHTLKKAILAAFNSQAGRLARVHD